MGLRTRIWASRGGGTEEKEKDEEEKISHMCESIGHRSLRGRCPKNKNKNNLTIFFRSARAAVTGIKELGKEKSLIGKCGLEPRI